MARSAARRSATGALNVTTTGCATPTTSPRLGRTDAIASPSGPFAAATLTPAGPATTLAAITLIARTHRTTARMALYSRRNEVVIVMVGLTCSLKVRAHVDNSAL